MFNIDYMGRVSSGANNETKKIWIYNGSIDGSNEAVATIAASGYFNPFMVSLDLGLGPLSINDLIFIVGNDAYAMYTVTAVVTNVVVSVFAATGVVGTANIQDAAVTTPKIADANVTTAKLAANAVTSAKVDPQLLQYLEVDLTAANALAMFGAPVQVLAAQGANTLILVEHACLAMDYNTTAYAAGGAIGLQYGNTANLAGEAATATIPAANFQGAADTADMVAGILASGVFTGCENLGLFISNLTAAFTTGNSPLKLHIWFRVIPTF